MRPPLEPRFLQSWQRILLWSLGGVAFVAGATAVFTTENGSGAVALLVFSGLALAVAVLGDRIERFEFGGATLRLRAAAADRYAQAEQAEEDGDSPSAAQLRDEAHALLDAAGPLLTDYRSTRATMPSGPARVRALERIMSRGRQLARTQAFAPEEVRKWLSNGNDEERITALGLMQADTSLRDFSAVLTVLTKPRSAFEHYHAMVLAEQMLDELEPEQRADLAKALRGEQVQNLRPNSDRRVLSNAILRALAPSV
ncbi:hypothetical protein [Nocardiopsis metallicus]|uniref:Uncharacterized protein n=1 Tax=Nocardiopsis metallicus TaxID=179819 RepID=A0A840WG36_9ACTN|nr:hypothetical protein [Nocardiopsis metallicus]MBB5491971.1 hypothetical protein [Nocardiopsis metallicus]